MRILLLIPSMNPEDGGPVEGLKRSSAELAAMGHETEVVTLDPPNASFLSEAGVQVHGLGNKFSFRGISPKLPAWIVANASRFDVAIVHGIWSFASMGGWLGLRLAGLPYVLFTHGMMDPWFRATYPLKHVLKQIVWLLAQGWALRDAKYVLFTSEEECRLARGQFWGPSYSERVVSYGIADVPDYPERQKAAFGTTIPLLEKRRYLLFLSRIHLKKGCDLLVDAFAKVAARHPDLDLVIAGPDQTGWRCELEAQAQKAGISNRIHWPGMVQGDAKWGAFRSAEAFILPSHQENFGIVVAEAMACGTPVLISDKVNIWREVAASGGGLVAPDTVEGTQDLIERFMELSADEKAGMGSLARNAYLRHFGIEEVAEDLLRVLEQARSG